MGDGNIGIEEIIKTYVAKCPGKAVSLEVIVQGNWRLFNYRDPAAWEIFQSVPASGFARFLALAEKGVAEGVTPARTGACGWGWRRSGPRRGRAARWRGRGRGMPSPEAQARNLADVEASVRWTRTSSGVCRRPGASEVSAPIRAGREASRSS